MLSVWAYHNPSVTWASRAWQYGFFCVLMYKPPLGKVSQKRLQVLRDSQDGFVISEKDLEIRGPGEGWAPNRRVLPNLRWRI